MGGLRRGRRRRGGSEGIGGGWEGSGGEGGGWEGSDGEGGGVEKRFQGEGRVQDLHLFLLIK